MPYDVIVVGAGPAGSTAARESALRGLSVLMLDKAEFPRDKPCGGAVSVRCANVLDLDLTPVIERTISGAKFTWRQGLECSRSSSSVIAYMTQRRHLDTFLAEQAVDAGVDFRQREGLKSVERSGDHVTVRAGGHSYQGRALVGADGANGTTAKMAGIQPDFMHAIAPGGEHHAERSVPSQVGDIHRGRLRRFARRVRLGVPQGGSFEHWPRGLEARWSDAAPQTRPAREVLRVRSHRPLGNARPSTADTL